MFNPYRTMEIENPKDFVFGTAKYPLRYGLDLEVGNGQVVPEINYAPRPGLEKDLERLKNEYVEIAEQVLERAINLGFPSVQLETEYVSQMTFRPSWGEEIIRSQKEILERYHDEYGIKCALRATIGDIRTAEDGLRKGRNFSLMMESFERAARHADLLSIESIGGKEVFNHSIIRKDVPGIILAIAVLGSLDMEYIWKEIVGIAKNNKIIPAGDTDCAHANTAMQLANGLLGKDLPHVLAAIIRVIAATRSLVAYEQGAVGPGKDCGYENVIIKAITGYPMSQEGKTSACAHSDLLGNIIAATCDLWSNESVEQTDMFGGSSVQVFIEILGYDAALLNSALKTGNHFALQQCLIQSDKYRDPQAFVLAPDIALKIGKVIVSNPSSYYSRAVSAALEAIRLIREAIDHGFLKLNLLEVKYLGEIEGSLRHLPDSQDKFIEKVLPDIKGHIEGFTMRNYEV